MRYSLGVIVGLALANGFALAAAPPREKQITIFHRGGELNSQVHGVDASGNVFGLREMADAEGHSQKAFWRAANGTEKLIPALPGYNYSHPYAVSAKSGVVFGVAGRTIGANNGSMQAFAWNPATGSIEGLGFVGKDTASAAWSASADGNTVAGCSTGDEKGIRPCVWTRDGKGWKATELSAPLDDNPLLATTGLRISPDGTKIVGSLTFKIVLKGRIYISHLHMWEKQADGSWSRKEISEDGVATGVNDSGMVVGYFGTEDGHRAFVITPKDGFKDIGVLPDSEGSRATGVNNSGTVVGYSGRSGYELAFVWKDGEMEALALPKDIILSAAYSINEQGQIAGYLGGEEDAQISSFVTPAKK